MINHKEVEMIRRVEPLGDKSIIDEAIATSTLKNVLKEIGISDEHIYLSNGNLDLKKGEVSLSKDRGKKIEDVVVEASFVTEIRSAEHAEFRVRDNYNIPLLASNGSFLVIPINVSNTMKIKIRVESRSMGLLENTISRLEIKSRVNEFSRLQDVLIRYKLPLYLIRFLKPLFEIRKSVLGDVDTFIDFLNIISIKDLTLFSTITGSSEVVGVKEESLKCLGKFSENYLGLQPTLDIGKGRYSMDIEYTLYYTRPTFLDIRYGITYLNRPLPKEYIRDTRPRVNPATINVMKGMLDIGDIEHYIKSGVDKFIYNNYLHLPSIDKYTDFKNIFPTMLSILVIPDETDILLNLKELGQASLDGFVTGFLESSEYEYIGQDEASIFNVTLYDGADRLPNTLIVDEELNVKTTHLLTPEGTYRILLSVADDFNMVPASAVIRLNRYKEKLSEESGISNTTAFNRSFPSYAIPLLASTGLHENYSDMMDVLDSLETFNRYIEETFFKDIDILTIPLISDGSLDTTDINILKDTVNFVNIDIEQVVYTYINGNRIIFKTFNDDVYRGVIDKGKISFITSEDILYLSHSLYVRREVDGTYNINSNGTIVNTYNSLSDFLSTNLNIITSLDYGTKERYYGTNEKSILFSAVLAQNLKINK